MNGTKNEALWIQFYTSCHLTMQWYHNDGCYILWWYVAVLEIFLGNRTIVHFPIGKNPQCKEHLIELVSATLLPQICVDPCYSIGSRKGVRISTSLAALILPPPRLLILWCGVSICGFSDVKPAEKRKAHYILST